MNETVVDRVLDILEKNCTNGSESKREGKFCRAIFDGYLCWPETKAGQLVIQSCSNELLKSTEKGLASKQCTEDGDWLIPENHTNHWTNLTQCGGFYIDLNATGAPSLSPLYSEWIPILKNISYFGYAISIVSLIMALSIFINIKRLHCPRNKLHINLFLSFILRYFMSIMKDGLFVKGTALSYDVEYDVNGEPKFLEDFDYSWVCKTIISVRWYFILSNFMMMLMEGVYLHNLMFLNLFSDHHGITIYCVLGWGLPVLFVIPWIIARILHENVLCWTQKDNSYISLIIEVPIRISVVINFILFLIIVRVLVVKLNSAWIYQRKIKYRKLLKATLILIPLFGVPYTLSLLMSFYIDENQVLEIIWLFVDQTFTAFQGLFAALVYCLLNTEAQLEIRRKYSSLRDRNDREFRRSRTISNTQQFCMHAMDDAENIHQNGNGASLEEIVTK